MPDFELLERWAAGDRAAGSQLFRRHFKSIYRFFRNKVGPQAEDLTQQTFLACVESAGRIRQGERFRQFALSVARNVLYNEYRRRRRKDDPIDFLSASAIDLSPSPSVVVEAKAERKLVLSALRTLPLDYQIALELYVWEDLSARELAGVLSLGEPGVRSRLRRAKEALREAIMRLQDVPGILDSTQSDLEDWVDNVRRILREPPSDGEGQPQGPVGQDGELDDEEREPQGDGADPS